MYCFRITTNVDRERYQGYPGVRLTVTDLQVIAPAEVTEGQSAILICKTTCSLTDPTFIWYKNRRDFTTKTTKSNELHLQPVSSEVAGSYSCAVRGYEHLPSPAQTLRVRCELYLPSYIFYNSIEHKSLNLGITNVYRIPSL
ncbi:hypothetical protein AMELA_G00234880 [Ameiurus melas]|uniref:Ig-like domain-containing protein n=1 Tax=Ameiurus melas TaxID=219545 RepID=A0A7J6A1Y2_AMEME|nr:hypothetical protein AMELA_G00234880 [Ameiurus melas]